jgi:hypothetical protein
MFRPSAIMVLCAAVVAAQPVVAQSKKKAANTSAFSSRTDNKDGSSSLTFGTALPTTIDTKLGVDLGLAGQGDIPSDPGRFLEQPSDRGSGAGWASMLVPAMPLGFTKAKVDARLDPTQDQGKFGLAVSRPIGESFLMTLHNSYAVTGAAIPILPAQHDYAVETGRTLRFDVLSTSTAFSAGIRSSTMDDKELRTLSAEQQIIGPLSVTGTINETPTGVIDKIFKAGFKKIW